MSYFVAIDYPEILKGGMQHAGKVIYNNLGVRIDSDPKRWRILADVLCDFGTGLEVLSPLSPQLFSGNFWAWRFCRRMAVVVARATRLPIYSSLAKEGNLRMPAAPANTLNPLRMDMIVADFLKSLRLFCPRRFCSYSVMTGKVSSPADIRHREGLLFPGRLIEDAGNMKVVGRPLHNVTKPSQNGRKSFRRRNSS
ncbi:hypothetical protein MLD38_028054 [Melastoma candidum]|uniref:Uncharacterized protein n=1 Tax=Melastoma candidum TaxID=119954 RepID=A0ACB9MZY3_9MYRT|nr:hypothetical protein MLD38_028054 [Melastoma candidum]